MKRKLFKNLAFILIGCFLIAGAASAGYPAEPLVSDLPTELQERFENIRKSLLKAYDVCTEHCGNDGACFDRCNKAYESRLEKEYQKLLHEM